MEIVILPKAEDDLLYWKRTGNRRIMKRIEVLLSDILEHPFEGIGKPEVSDHPFKEAVPLVEGFFKGHIAKLSGPRHT